MLNKTITYNSFFVLLYIHSREENKKTQLSKSKWKLPFSIICSSKNKKGRIVQVKHVRKFNEHYLLGHIKKESNAQLDHNKTMSFLQEFG